MPRATVNAGLDFKNYVLCVFTRSFLKYIFSFYNVLFTMLGTQGLLCKIVIGFERNQVSIALIIYPLPKNFASDFSQDICVSVCVYPYE